MVVSKGMKKEAHTYKLQFNKGMKYLYIHNYDKYINITSTPPFSFRACDTMARPFAVACALAMIASASPDFTK